MARPVPTWACQHHCIRTSSHLLFSHQQGPLLPALRTYRPTAKPRVIRNEKIYVLTLIRYFSDKLHINIIYPRAYISIYHHHRGVDPDDRNDMGLLCIFVALDVQFSSYLFVRTQLCVCRDYYNTLFTPNFFASYAPTTLRIFKYRFLIRKVGSSSKKIKLSSCSRFPASAIRQCAHICHLKRGQPAARSHTKATEFKKVKTSTYIREIRIHVLLGQKQMSGNLAGLR